MTQTDQDQELVLGNKQLLSAFFVVVALLGVFFTAGYIIGRNTGAKSAVTDSASAPVSSTEAPQRAVTRTAEPVQEKPSPAAAAPARTAPVETDTSQPAIKPVKAPETVTAPEPVGAVSAQVTPGHQYLQLMAVKRPVADSMVKLLKGRGYPALLGESSKPELFRVLVGPFTDMTTLAKTKAGLKSAGFESVIAK